tara:strand:- start:4 stop:1242 length:1239 start_codon:yes stop_codon:yes gene_type:complete
MVAGSFDSRMDMNNTETVFNDDSRDLDFRVESAGNVNALFVDGGNNVVVVGSNVAENRLAQPLAVTTAGTRGGVTISSFFNSASGPIMDFQVSRNDTAGSHTIVQTDDALGTIIFRGDDGDEFKDAGAIECNCDATPGNDDMSGRLSFFTAPDGSGGLVERMRLGQQGDFCVGPTLTNAGGSFRTSNGFRVINGTGGSSSDSGYLEHTRTTTTDASANFYMSNGQAGHRFFSFNNGSSQIGSISNNGNTAVAYNTSSDYRLKENVTGISDGITRVKQLQPKKFNWIVDETNTPIDGFLAHEAQTVVPEAVTGTKDETKDEEYTVTAAKGEIFTPATGDADEVIHSTDVERPTNLEDGKRWRQKTDAVMGTRNVPVYQGIDQAKLVPVLTAALQEAIAKIETLETKVAALEAE